MLNFYMIVKKENEEGGDEIGSYTRVEFSQEALDTVYENPYLTHSDITYPDIVWKAAKVITDVLSVETPEATPRSIYLASCDFFLTRFIAEGKVAMSEDDLTDILWKAINTTSLDSLIQKGMIDSMPSSSGEPVYWITPEGIQKVKELGIMGPSS